ncbi:hypothetical protein [Microvirga puerhi]|uniref:Uncharacterized protein n=1 Tax=Microvirga puerhi TaxID=2876078 RepID=A0ABS7VU91_9HYPH|nr:hypothetical protein [Microvirga puerhi]MBZ6079139.1 hypothetical protein [Microvirga puerhi]
MKSDSPRWKDHVRVPFALVLFIPTLPLVIPVAPAKDARVFTRGLAELFKNKSRQQGMKLSFNNAL